MKAWIVCATAVGLGACAAGAARQSSEPVLLPRSQEPALSWLLTRFADPTGRDVLDTLVISPDTVELRVGHHIDLGTTLRIVGLTGSGDTVGAVIPVMNVEGSGDWIVQTTERGLRGWHPGVAIVMVTPLVPAPRPVVTRLPVRVRE